MQRERKSLCLNAVVWLQELAKLMSWILQVTWGHRICHCKSSANFRNRVVAISNGPVIYRGRDVYHSGLLWIFSAWLSGKKKKGCCCIYFVLALVLCWLGTNVLCCAKGRLQRAIYRIYLPFHCFSSEFLEGVCFDSALSCTGFHSLLPVKVQKSHFLIP